MSATGRSGAGKTGPKASFAGRAALEPPVSEAGVAAEERSQAARRSAPRARGNRMTEEVGARLPNVKANSTHCIGSARLPAVQGSSRDARRKACRTSSAATPPASWAAASRRRRAGFPNEGATRPANPSGASFHSSTWALGCRSPSTPRPVTKVAHSSMVRAAFFTACARRLRQSVPSAERPSRSPAGPEQSSALPAS